VAVAYLLEGIDLAVGEALDLVDRAVRAVTWESAIVPYLSW